jgi:hypothetical protein
MKRLQIGLIAVVLLIASAVRYSTTGNPNDAILGGLLRIGLVMGALWLALPALMTFFTKTPKWMLIGLLAAVILFAIQPKLLWWIPVLMIGIWFAWSRFGIGQIVTGAGPARAPRRPKRKA